LFNSSVEMNQMIWVIGIVDIVQFISFRFFGIMVILTILHKISIIMNRLLNIWNRISFIGIPGLADHDKRSIIILNRFGHAERSRSI